MMERSPSRTITRSGSSMIVRRPPCSTRSRRRSRRSSSRTPRRSPKPPPNRSRRWIGGAAPSAEPSVLHREALRGAVAVTGKGRPAAGQERRALPADARPLRLGRPAPAVRTGQDVQDGAPARLSCPAGALPLHAAAASCWRCSCSFCCWRRSCSSPLGPARAGAVPADAAAALVFLTAVLLELPLLAFLLTLALFLLALLPLFCC